MTRAVGAVGANPQRKVEQHSGSVTTLCDSDSRAMGSAAFAPTLCFYCEEPVKQQWWVPYCSKTCRRQARDEGSLPPVQAYAPVEWDGQTHYSAVPERVYMYARLCGLCAREQGDHVFITHQRAALMERAGLAACTVCRGWVQMDCLELGAIGSPARAVPSSSRVVAGVRADGRKAL